MSLQAHWEKLYKNNALENVSWYQPVPAVSLGFIHELGIAKDAAIIDVGGGDSLLADHLLEQGYTDITVLDISGAAIEKAKARLGNRASLVHWVIADITLFEPERVYDCWHDRAAFHFLTTEDEIHQYLEVASRSIASSGKLILGTFSETGPGKCSGLLVKQYSENSLSKQIGQWFRKIHCILTDHITPARQVQHFIFCSFKKTT